MSMVFCTRDELLAEVSGWAAGVEAPEGRVFEQFIGQAARGLFVDK